MSRFALQKGRGDALTRLVELSVAICLVIVGHLTEAAAQEGGGAGEGGSEFSLFIGSMLPNQIDGVTEILPVFGGRYGIPTSRIGVAEFGIGNTHAEGVDFTTFSGSLRADLPAIDQFVGFVYGGLDISYFRPAGSEDRKTDTGLHVGAGLSVHASDTLWFRSDLKFNASPGTSLSLLFGIVFQSN
ncbi:MAG: hypothetical protein J0L82_06590 [Deltaproteobacteria bacterium]|nr:hypothetical protein [Deltaproteobacteria bacterium]